ncbi:MAG TPA: energy transducer TonB [Opitutaceae bacterium]|nr:energy transducer TonB [Opitutaceae bacterium]
MKAPLLACAALLCQLAAARAAGPAPSIPCRYGVPAAFEQGSLDYPDVTVRWVRRERYPLLSGPPEWEVCVLNARPRGTRLAGSDFEFSSEHRVNARRVDVGGRIYVAEMFRTTAGGGRAHPLPEGQIVLWDQASAEAGNPALAPIWGHEQVDPDARNSVANAYDDGRWIPKFDGFDRLLPDRPAGASAEGALIGSVRRVPFERLPADASTQSAQYGAPVRFDRGILRFPAFRLSLWIRYAWPQPRPAGYLGWPDFNFIAYDPAGKRAGGAVFSRNAANGFRFAVDGIPYFVEMGFTTAGLPAGGRAHRPLPDGTIVAWDRAHAERDNPAVAALLHEPPPDAADIAASFADGAPVGGMFTGDYLLFSNIPASALDAVPLVVRRAPFVYPGALRGSGFRGRVNGFFEINPDGSLHSAVALGGNEPRFKKAVEDCIRQWRFTPPRQKGKPVAAYLNFTADIPDDGSTELALDLN